MTETRLRSLDEFCVTQGDLVLLMGDPIKNPRLFLFERFDGGRVIGRNGYELKEPRHMGDAFIIPDYRRLETWNGGESRHPLEAKKIYVGARDVREGLLAHGLPIYANSIIENGADS